MARTRSLPEPRLGRFAAFVPDRKAAFRLALLLLAGLFAFVLTLRATAAGVFESARPASALRWLPANAGARAGMAARLLAADRTQDARVLAQSALLRDPTSVIALRTLALAAEADARVDEAERLMLLANRLSRRDRPTQVWLLRNAISRGDFAGAVRRFDLAMRTSNRAAAQLTPLLMAATADPRLLPPLRATLRQGPAWKTSFLQLLAGGGPRLDHIVALTDGLLDPADAGESAVIDTLVGRLAGAGQYDLGWRVYRGGRGGRADPAVLRNGGFEESDPRPPFDWRYTDEADLAAVRQRRPDGAPGNALALIAQNGRSGELARQYLRLAPGRYRIEAELGGLPTDARARPTLTLACATGGDAFASLRPEGSGEPARRAAASAVVPASCRWQLLTIAAQSSDGGPTPWLDNLSIRPIS